MMVSTTAFTTSACLLALLVVLSLVAVVLVDGFVVPTPKHQRQISQIPTASTTRIFGSMDSLMGKLVDTAADGGGASVGAGGALSFDDPMVMAGVAAVLAIGGIAAAMTSSSNGGSDSATGSSKTAKEPEPEPIDVSIPYDAAAVFSYKELKGPAFSKKGYDQIVASSDFKTFSKEYKGIAVEEIALKVETKKFEEKKSKFEEKKSNFMAAYSSASK